MRALKYAHLASNPYGASNCVSGSHIDPIAHVTLSGGFWVRQTSDEAWIESQMHSKHGLCDRFACPWPSDITNNLHSNMSALKSRSISSVHSIHVVRRAWQHEPDSCEYSNMSLIRHTSPLLCPPVLRFYVYLMYGPNTARF